MEVIPFFLTVAADSEQNEVIGINFEVILLLNEIKEILNIFLTDGDDLPAFLTHQVMV